MNQKTLVVLGAAALVAVGAALVVDRARAPQSDVSARAGLLVPELREHVNDVTRINLTTANNQATVTLVRGDKGWTVAQRGNYPADVGKLREYLLKLADATLLEEKTSNKERYADLGVEDITAPTAKGVLLELDGLPKPARVFIGSINAQGGGGTFVRLPEQAPAWLAKGSLVPEKNPADWLARDLPGVSAERIASVTITHADGKVLRVAKKAEGDSTFSIVDIPKGREPGSEYVANGLGSVLAELRLDDVAALAEVAPPATATKVRYTTFDGLVVDASAWKIGDKAHATFKASLDAAVADSHAAAAQARAAADHAAAVANVPATEVDAADAGATDATAAAAPQPPAPPLAVTDPAKDREQRRAALDSEVARLDAAFTGWSFVLPAHKYANIDKSLEDLLKPVEAKVPAKAR